MRTLRLFIASSSPAIGLTQKLCDAIDKRLRAINKPRSLSDPIQVESVLWWDKGFQPGESTLGSLIEECKKCDFAAVFLTEDDVTLKNGLEQLQPRDNCIFEAGLFTGALSLEPKRVFLLTPVKTVSELPSDLAGIAFIEITLTQNNEDIGNSVDQAAGRVIEGMIREGVHYRGRIPYIAEDDLMNYERPEAEKGRLVPFSRIVVQNKQPLEYLDPGFAQRVQKNITNEIRYRYFFHADLDSVSMIARLIWTLGSSGIDGTVAEKNRQMKDNPSIVLQNLSGIHTHLSIQFLPKPPKFEMCVHNSENEAKAVCYLRVPYTAAPVQFIEWYRGGAAKEVAQSFLDLRKDPPTNSIFRSTVDFDLEIEKDYVKKLCREIVNGFPPSIESDMSKICFPDRCIY